MEFKTSSNGHSTGVLVGKGEDKERKKMMQKQEELAKNEYKLKRLANHASVKNAYINLERKVQAPPAGGRSNKAIVNTEESEEDEGEDGTEDNFQDSNLISSVHCDTNKDDSR